MLLKCPSVSVRVLLLAPFILAISFQKSRRLQPSTVKAPLLPWFVVGFVALLVLSILTEIPVHVRQIETSSTGVLCSIALASLGLSTHLHAVVARGVKPLLDSTRSMKLSVGFRIRPVGCRG
jgi:uncharacterized membrane protein YadS